jgi:hypothetical protein
MIVIHIGLRKSGSTSIQSFLDHNAVALKAMSIDYPVVGRMNRAAHPNFANELLGRDRFRPEIGSLSDLVKYRRSSSAEFMVISSEMFEALPPEAVGRLREILSHLREPIRIVLVIRDLVSLIPSSYAEKVRYGHKKFDFDRFFEQRRLKDRVNYFMTAKRWADVFGKENLKSIALRQELIEDFVIAAGLPSTVTALPQPGVANAASGWRVLEAMRAFHKGFHHLPIDHALCGFAAECAPLRRADAYLHEVQLETEARNVGDAMGWMQDRGAYLTLEQARWCAETYDDAVTSMNNYFQYEIPVKRGLESRDFKAREFLPTASLIPPSQLRAFYDAVGSAVWKTPSVADGTQEPG